MLKDNKLFYIILVSLSAVIFAGGSLIALKRAGVQSSQTGTTSTGTVQPVNPATSGLYNYPDNPLDIEPKDMPVSPKYVVEHRTALNGKTIRIQGVIVSALLGEAACPQGRGICAKPRIILAETLEANRDKNYDIIVFVDEEDNKNFVVGRSIGLKVNVSGNKNAVSTTSLYNE